MMITKIALPRRTFLRGAGAALALPLLDAMVPALPALNQTPAHPVRRLGFVYLANGVAMNDSINYWRPKGRGAAFELSPILEPFGAFRQQMVVVSGLTHAQAETLGDGNGDHSRGTSTWLNGVHPRWTEGSDVQAGVTADQIAATELGRETPLPSLELGIDPNFVVGSCENGYSCTYMNTLAWRTPTTPLPTENNPRAVFERLFGDGGTPAARRAQMRRTRSVLDSVLDEADRLQQKLGAGDRTKISDYFDALREVERRIQKTEARGADAALLEATATPPAGIPERFADHVKLMFDLQWLAYRADITRVFTFMLGREVNSRTFPEIGVSEPHHGLSHHRDDPKQLEKLVKVNIYHASLFSSFLERLSTTPDGDGTLLDHSMLLYGAGLSNPNTHSHIDLPLVILGRGAGRLTGDRHLQYPIGTPMTNLLLTLLDKVGVATERLGDSTGRLNLLTGV
ncbi:MAG: hypothetical protein DMF89_17090 [Acidobacteria bacterium]|nr:MAG: hypothetical protein DMF89_17090 [Acidobacteriota bacterium]